MSLTFDPDTGDPIHTPKRRDVFEFDEEVASVFENMAVRSIPLYAETHRLHAAIAYKYAQDFLSGRQYVVADVGASTGMFLKMLSTRYGLKPHQNPSYYRALAIDPSQPMLDRLSSSLPWVLTVNMEAQYLERLDERFDIVNASYLFQFIPPHELDRALQSIANCTRSGGLLFVSQKSSIPNVFSQYFNDEYIHFREDNGYSKKEIADKTESLKNSMWTSTLEGTKQLLYAQGFYSFQDTTSWANFNSFVCIKR